MSFFGRLFARGKSATPPHQALVMVMLDGDAFDAAATHQHLIAYWQDLPSMMGWETTDGITMASIPGGTLALAHMPISIPSGDLTGPVAVAWHWAEAASAVAAHRSHVVVHVASTDIDVIDLRLFLTKVVSSILTTNGGIGVYVGDAMLVRSAADYRTDAAEASRENLPLLSWVGFNPVKEENALSGYTTGLTAFGLPELEVRRSTETIDQLLGTLADVANYELSSGQVLKDGDTFGATEFDRKRVVYGPSAFIPDLTVAALELP